MGEKKSILFITNLFSQMDRGKAVSETLNELLTDKGWTIFMASGKANKILRLLDMLLTSWKNRHNYECAFVEIYSGAAFIWAEIVCFFLQKLNKPLILGLFGGNLPALAKKNPGRVKRLLLSARLVTAPSKYIIDEISPLVSGKIVYFPYGVALDRFRFRIRTNPKPNLIAMRGFHRIYCPWVAVETVALLKSEFPDIHLIMTGGDKHDGSSELSKKIIEDNALEQSIRITGYLPHENLEQYVTDSDILLNSPMIDNTPVSVIQAMACGLCIVSTDIGGLSYLIEDEINGLLVPPNDPQAMAKAVRRILTEPGLAERLSDNAHHKAKQYDWSIVLPRWEELFLLKGEIR